MCGKIHSITFWVFGGANLGDEESNSGYYKEKILETYKEIKIFALH